MQSHTDSTQKREINTRILITIIGAFIHTLIAFITANHTKIDYNRNSQHDYVFDFLMNLLYFTTIDATLVVLNVSRSGIRIWHWKINSVFAVSVIIFYFSDDKLMHYGLFLLVLIFAYLKLENEKVVCKVGLSKYMKSSTSDYHDISIKRNYKYVVLTLIEAALIYYHKVFILSPLLFVIIDAVHNRLTQTPRTKLNI